MYRSRFRQWFTHSLKELFCGLFSKLNDWHQYELCWVHNNVDLRTKLRWIIVLYVTFRVQMCSSRLGQSSVLSIASVSWTRHRSIHNKWWSRRHRKFRKTRFARVPLVVNELDGAQYNACLPLLCSIFTNWGASKSVLSPWRLCLYN